ncbi:MAG: META domain-containing protein [Amaricoccus sp.]
MIRSLVLAGALALGAIAANAAEIRGIATYRERMALPPDARLEVDLLDVSRADAPAERVAGATFAIGNQVPIGFLLPYDPAAIDAGHRYELAARILRGDGLLFSSQGTVPVAVPAAGPPVEIMLHRAVPPATAGKEALVADWVAEEIGGAPVADKVVSSLTLAADGSAHGGGGCNNFSGQWQLDGTRLILGPMAATMMACPPPQSDQEAALFKAFDATRGFRVDSGRLVLLDAAGSSLARLARAP